MLHSDDDPVKPPVPNVNAAAPTPPTSTPVVSPSTLLQPAPRTAAPSTAPVFTATVTPPPAPVFAAPQPQTSRPYMNQNLISSLSLENNIAPLSATPAAEAVKNFLETAKVAIGAPSPDYTITLMPIQRTDTSVNLFASSIIVIVQHTAALSKGLGYHTLILADTAGQLQAEFIQINNMQVEVIRVIGEAYDKDYRTVVAQQLAKQFPNVPPAAMYDSEGEVIPTGYNYKDANLVQTTLASALVAAGTLLNQNTDGFKDLSLQQGADQIQSIAKLQFNQPPSIDSVGMPQRTDVTVTYFEVTGQQRAQGGGVQSLNSGQRSTPLFKLGGFMDLGWNPVTEVTAHNPYAAAYGQTVATQTMPHLYQPRFIITNVDAKTLKTLPGQLLGMATVLTLRQDNNWMLGFRRMAGMEKDIHDIGAIGIEANIEKNPSNYGNPIDTRSANFTDTDLAMLLKAFVRPELAISLDVDECGPTTWLNSVFLAEAKGSAVARQVILDAANLLTNGKFGQIFPNGGRIMINDQSRIHLGHYTDSSGNTRDLRDIDYLCVLNILGDRDPKQARDWSDTFAKIGYPMELRLQGRRRVMDLISPNITITGYAQRVTFTTVFLDALEKAVAATGLSIRSETPYQDTSAGARATADWLQAGALSPNAQSMFTRSFGTQQPGASYGSPGSFGRWN